MKKEEIEYSNKYGDIPKDDIKRLNYFFLNNRLSKNVKTSIFPTINKNLNIKWKQINFVLYLLPKATPRPRYNFQKHIFYVNGAKKNKEKFIKFINKCDIDLITTPCKFKCISYLPIPSSMSTLEKLLAELQLIYPITKPDWDNIGKTYSDMIQGSLIYDDSLIIEGISKKYYSLKPRVEIEIEYMETYDSEYNKKKIRNKFN